MAISKDKKQALVRELTELFANAKGTAVAKYQGISVAELQDLRKSARAAGVTSDSLDDIFGSVEKHGWA
jgi:ribosomal protein L10